MREKKMTITEYLKTNSLYEPNTVFDSVIPDFIKADNFQNVLKAVMNQMYGGYNLLDKFSEDTENIPMVCVQLYAMNAYKYSGLYESTLLKFDPIENYNMIETLDETQNGHNENTIDYGTKTLTSVYGATESTIDYGELSTEKDYGARNTTDRQDVVPYEKTAGYTKERQNIVETGTYKDTDSLKAHTDKETTAERTDTATDSGHTDITSGDDSRNITRTLTRKGNIGVTSSTELAENYRKFVDFSLYKEVAEDLMRVLCNRFISVSEMCRY